MKLGVVQQLSLGLAVALGAAVDLAAQAPPPTSIRVTDDIPGRDAPAAQQPAPAAPTARPPVARPVVDPAGRGVPQGRPRGGRRADARLGRRGPVVAPLARRGRGPAAGDPDGRWRRRLRRQVHGRPQGDRQSERELLHDAELHRGLLWSLARREGAVSSHKTSGGRTPRGTGCSGPPPASVCSRAGGFPSSRSCAMQSHANRLADRERDASGHGVRRLVLPMASILPS